MILLSIFLLIAVLAIVLGTKYATNGYDEMHPGFVSVAAIAILIVVISLILIPIGRMGDHDAVINYCNIKQSIDEQRAGSIPLGSSAIERATIGVELAKAKAEVAKIEYWNKSWWMNKAWHIEDTSCSPAS